MLHKCYLAQANRLEGSYMYMYNIVQFNKFVVVRILPYIMRAPLLIMGRGYFRQLPKGSFCRFQLFIFLSCNICKTHSCCW